MRKIFSRAILTMAAAVFGFSCNYGIEKRGTKSTSSIVWEIAFTTPAHALSCEVTPQACTELPPITIAGTTIGIGPNTGSPIARGALGWSLGGGLSLGVGLSGGGALLGNFAARVSILLGNAQIDFSKSATLGGSADTYCVGDPINVVTGNQFMAEADYTTVGSFPLVLARYYNSVDQGGLHDFGSHWRGSYSR